MAPPQRNGPGDCSEAIRASPGYWRFVLLPIVGTSDLSALATLAVRPDDHPTARGHDALAHQRALRAIGVISVGIPISVAISPVVIARTDAESERADLNAGAAGVRAHIDLSGGRNRRHECSRGCRGKQQFP